MNPNTIDLWSNAVAGGWEPEELETGLGGSEEVLVLWSAALAARGHRVRVYRNPRRAQAGSGSPSARRHLDVTWLPHAAFDPYARRDVLVSWKSPHPWRVGALARRRLHWSSDVEPPWSAAMLAQVDAVVALTPYHRRRLEWLPEAKARVIPHGIDLAHLEAHRVPKVAGRALYCSSPDRGLETLLREWPRLRAQHAGIELDVCYGWRLFEACTLGDPAAEAWRAEMERLLAQRGIRNRGQVGRGELARAYWAAERWLLPLARADSELFCLNAVKAQHAGALPVVNRIGALADTVTRWIDYADFREGRSTLHEAPPFPALGWDEVVKRYWEPMF
jgi:glycosyltransferase involved in cell wall biosynthesis